MVKLVRMILGSPTTTSGSYQVSWGLGWVGWYSPWGQVCHGSLPMCTFFLCSSPPVLNHISCQLVSLVVTRGFTCSICILRVAPGVSDLIVRPVCKYQSWYMVHNDQTCVDDENPWWWCWQWYSSTWYLWYYLVMVMMMKYLQCGAKRGGWDEI